MTKPPRDVLEKFNAYYKYDTAFSAYSRLLQSQWREKEKLPAGKLGNYIETETAKKWKANYLTENIKNLVVDEIKNTRITKGLMNETRVWTNLLSSQPLCFNLFGELYYDLELATKFFKKLFPKRINEVTSIKFEYSPGRKLKEYTGDSSAFDVFVEYINKKGNKGFIGIEVKYAECLREEAKKKAAENYKSHETEYVKLTTEFYFKPNAITSLQQVPLSQIWRDHLLAIAMLNHKDKKYDEGFFIFLFPSKNNDCQKGVDLYKQYLASEDEESNGFYPRHLEDFILILTQISNAEWTKKLKERYFGELI